ncbi:MAG: ATP-dependent sacrificial sulfur transferase LarE [Promethearchaeota archaeon]
MDLPEEVNNKLKELISFLKNKRVLIAFSGGVDSSLLAYLSNMYAEETLLITEKSILYPEDEIECARAFALKYGMPHMFLERNPLKEKEFTENPKNRCYICKKGLYQSIIKKMASKNFDLIIDGSNMDDLSDYRPGLEALKELNVETPYIKFNINKQEIRKIADSFNLNIHLKPSMACYSSRIPYGLTIDEEKLKRIREGERFLKETFQLKQLRVRHHAERLARIEFLAEDLPLILEMNNINLIKRKFKELGFCYITIDLEGFRSGSMNESLSFQNNQIKD